MSAYPGDQSEEKAVQKLNAFLDAGIQTFVGLQTKSELGRFTNYIDKIKDINQKRNKVLPLEFLELEIPGSIFFLLHSNIYLDGHVAEDSAVEPMITEIVRRYSAGENILIHCWGGNVFIQIFVLMFF